MTTRKRINLALNNINREISDNARRGGRFASGLSAEGYAGGYRDALHDLLLLLSKVDPDRRGYWDLPPVAPPSLMPDD